MVTLAENLGAMISYARRGLHQHPKEVEPKIASLSIDKIQCVHALETGWLWSFLSMCPSILVNHSSVCEILTQAYTENRTLDLYSACHL
jgi:hypothetical protein